MDLASSAANHSDLLQVVQPGVASLTRTSVDFLVKYVILRKPLGDFMLPYIACKYRGDASLSCMVMHG